MTASTTLSFRRAGSPTWVEIDPTTPAGQRLLAGFGISTTEETMTATTAQAAAAAAGNGRAARLAFAPDANRENMGMLLRTRRAARNYLDRARTSAASAWAWLVRTTHLDTAWRYVKDGIAWIGDKLAIAARFLGASGMTGAGLLAIATDTGRKVLGGILKPIGWVLGLFGRGYVAVENMLFNENRSGGIRNWISMRMADARIWAFGDDTKAGKTGLIPSGLMWVARKVGGHLALDSMAMRITRSAGILMLAPKLMALLAFLPVGGLYWPLRFLASVAIGYFVWVPVSGTLMSLWARMTGFVRTEAEAADKTVSKTAEVIKGEVVEEQHKAEKAAAHTATRTPAQPRTAPVGRNRAERRASTRA